MKTCFVGIRLDTYHPEALFQILKHPIVVEAAAFQLQRPVSDQLPAQNPAFWSILILPQKPANCPDLFLRTA